MSQNNNINIIFYSKTCDDCKTLLTLLQNEGMLQNFVMYCVDGRLKEIPPSITTVPTMTVASINKPLVGKETFEWVNKMKFIKEQNMMNINKHNIMKLNLMRMENKNGPHGFFNEEMNGISDNFAYTKTDIALPHRYSGATENKGAIFTAPDEKKKISKEEQKKRIESITKTRTEQDNVNSESMKKQQLNAVIQAEQEKMIQDNPQMQQTLVQQNNLLEQQQLQQRQQMQQFMNNMVNKK
jgi:hypothetical protein